MGVGNLSTGVDAGRKTARLSLSRLDLEGGRKGDIAVDQLEPGHRFLDVQRWLPTSPTEKARSTFAICARGLWSTARVSPWYTSVPGSLRASASSWTMRSEIEA